MGKANLTALRIRDLYGLEIGEDWSPRLLLTGPNGTGKSARLRAILWALRGVKPGGLVPFASGPEPLVRATFAFDAGLLDGKTSVKEGFTIDREGVLDGAAIRNTASVIPSHGEDSLKAVDARVARDLRPNIFALDLNAWLGGSAQTRRRELLRVVGRTITVAHVIEKLDETFSGGDVPPSEWSPVWCKLRDAIGDSNVLDGFEYLGMIEKAAKAEASTARATVKSSAALLQQSSSDSFVAGEPRETLEQRRADLKEELEALAGQRVAQRALAEKIQRRGKQIEQMHQWLNANLDDAHYQNGDVGAIKRTCQSGIDAIDHRGAARGYEVANAIAGRDEYRATRRAKRTERDVLVGKIEALYTLLGIELDEEYGFANLALPEPPDKCPVCGAFGHAIPLDTLVRDQRSDLAGLNVEIDTLNGKVQDAEAAVDKVNADVAEAVAFRKRLSDALDRVRIIEEAQAELSTLALDSEAPVDEAGAEALRTSIAKLDETLEALAREEGRRETLALARQNLDKAEALLKDAQAVQRRSGPLGLAGELLKEIVAPVQEVLDRIYPEVYGLRLRLSLTDAHGKPGIELVADGSCSTIPFEGLSGGQRAVALAAFVAALASMSPDDYNVALVEAGELDEVSLIRFMDAIDVEALDDIVVATHLPVTCETTLGGFGVRPLQPVLFSRPT